MDLDLNQEPLDSSSGSIFRIGSLLNELETAHGHIEERIRQLEAVTSRARQRQRWRQSENIPQTLNHAVEPTTIAVHNDDTSVSERISVATQERTLRARKVVRRNNMHLVAKALDMAADATKTISCKGGFFDCNICLHMARDPILTRCGHLFCWPCFYQLSYVHLNVKECPVCMQEITDTNIIPIYGSGNQKSWLKESGLMIPPRPHAHRVESLKQELINHRAISSVIDRNIRLFSLIVAMEENSASRDVDGGTFMAERAGLLDNQSLASQVPPANATEDNQHHHPLQLPRLSLQGAASFSSLSYALTSAMDSAERLVEDLQASIHSLHMRRNNQPSFSVAEIRDRETLDNATDTDSTVAHPSSFRSDGAAAAVQLENQRTDTVAESNNIMSISSTSSNERHTVSRILEVENRMDVNPTMLHSSLSSRRRSEFPRVSDVGNGQYHESRRRRMS
ncbi:hypothetical protein JCGZ_05270 [Jatropha curcas]|uniref:E3 ubiquitin-protein ligase RMA n=1 Tax=Jatropha curcas TaxID=180498 RepID=A0A067J9G1_JATCU|nr:uncharacterized protein LOC105650336 [Jatropha curcas]KDP20387.1 hypothetical protein JCGZ_05270 [Jatropha curcas]